MVTMLVSKGPILCPSIKVGKGLSSDKCKNSFLGYYKSNNKIMQNRTIFSHYSELKVANGNALSATERECEFSWDVGPTKGIGILDYFQGKNIFITGATGLLGKVLVEKILRSTPVDKIYVLVKADDLEAARQRLAKELVNSDLFRCLREKHGKCYQDLMKEKLIPVVGNICQPNLGLDSQTATTIMEQVNVIIGSAAITTLNERYDLMVEANVNGAEGLMKFASACNNLELLVHISTAYVSGEEEGIISEKPRIMGVNPRKGDGKTTSCLLDVRGEVNLAMTSTTPTTNYQINMDMKRLGMDRARLYGWHNTYQMTKAMAEMVINERRGNVPVVIIRPSAIESCYKQPFLGWIQGNRMLDPLVISYGKGQLPAFFGNAHTPADIIPLDIVVNTTIAAIAKHGCMPKSDQLTVYQTASSVANPLTYSQFFDYIYEYFDSNPLIDLKTCSKIKLTRIKYFEDFNEFSKFTRKEISRRFGMKYTISVDAMIGNPTLEKRCKAQITYAENLCKMYGFLGFFNGRFHAGNTRKLCSEMSKEEKIGFDIDITKIDWREYYQDIHIPGLIKHVISDKVMSVV